LLTRGLTKVINNAPFYYRRIVANSIIVYYLPVDFFTITAMRNPRKNNLFPKMIILSAVVCLLLASFLKQPPIVIKATIEAPSIGVYWDSGCTNKVEAVDWGALYLDSVNSVETYVRNEGEAPIYFSLDTTSWQPLIASNYLSLDWNYAQQKVRPGDIVPVKFSLSVSANTRSITSFIFNIVVSPADMLMRVNLVMSFDQENYVVVDISIGSPERLEGGLGSYELNLSVTNNVDVVSASGGEAPFDAPPTITRADGKIKVAASIPKTQGPQISGQRIARLRLRLNSAIGVTSIIKPLSMTVTDALNGSVHNAAVLGTSWSPKRGDANNDGRVSIADAMVIAQYLVGSRPASDLNVLNAASVKQDGQLGDKISIADAMVIAQWLVGLGDQGS